MTMFMLFCVVFVALSKASQVCKDNDKDSSCSSLQRRGFCTDPTYVEYMVKDCQKTCNLCNPPITSKAAQAKKYRDTCGMRLTATSRIVSGTTANPGEWPWQVALYHWGSFQCGGVLISNQWVATSGHCANGPYHPASAFTVQVGIDEIGKPSNFTQSFYVVSKVNHPKFSFVTMDYDVTLLKLDRPVSFTRNVAPICLSNQVLDTNTVCFLSGWGKTSKNGPRTWTLQQAKMKFVDHNACANYNRLVNGQHQLRKLTKTMVCFEPNQNNPSAACNGDSGGPMACLNRNSGRFELEGLASWGNPLCDASYTHSVFAKVSDMKQWIKATTNVP